MWAEACCESIIIDVGDAGRDIDAVYGVACGERHVANVGDTVWDLNAGQSNAAIECIIADDGDTIREVEGGQTFTEAKCFMTNLGDRVRDFETVQACAVIESVIIDAGDAVQGTLFYHLYKGEVEQLILNELDYDIQLLGNHEFDYGWAQIKANLESADFEVLCANVLENGAPIYDGYTIVEKGGVKVGFFGLETPEAQTKTNPALIKGLDFLAEDELFACANEQVAALEAEGADVIICLSHLGIDASSEPNRSYDLWENTTDIDLIIDGHSHSVMTEGANGEPIQSTGTALANVGVVVIDNATKAIEDNFLFSLADYAGSDEAVAAAAKAIIDPIDAKYGEVFAESKVDLNGAKAEAARMAEVMKNVSVETLVYPE